MAIPTTLEALAADTLAAWQTTTAQARAESTAAQAALAAALAARQAAVDAQATATAEAASIRAALAAVPTGADATPLLDALDATTVASRSAAAALLAAERDEAVARSRLERAAAAVREAGVRTREAEATVVAATVEAQRRDDLAAALGESPLDTLVADANTLRTAPVAADAQAAAALGMPAKLLTRARERVTIARQRIANAAATLAALQALAAAETAGHGSREDKLALPQAQFDAAVAALQAHVAQAKQRYDRANGVLTRLASPQKVPLTAEQAARLADAGLTAAREAAADHESALDAARRDRELAEQERDVEQAKSDAGATNDLAAKETALTAALAAESAAETAYTAAERTLMAEWAAAAPDGFWRDIADCDEAVRTLDDLATHPGSALVTAMTAAETAYVAASVAAGDQLAALDLYRGAAAERATAVAFDAAAADRIALGALRGG